MDKKKISEHLKKLLSNLPPSPGVYKFKNEDGEVLYIGKAKRLDKRVRQYFRKNYQHSTRTKKLVEQITNFEILSVDSDLEAIILETNLIKQFKPKYNILMKDDKNYVYIKITNEDFPRIQIVREVKKDNAKYFGPKPAAYKVKETFKFLKKIFPFRHCNLGIKLLKDAEENKEAKVKISNKTIKYPCLDYYIKRCAAPCIGKVSKEEYKNIIQNIESFLNGKADNIINQLKDEMEKFASKKKFELAAKTRDKILKIEAILEKQKVASAENKTQDIINYCIAHEHAYFNLFQIRNGKLIGQENYTLTAKDLDSDSDLVANSEVLEAFLEQYYQIATDIPKEIIIPHKTSNSKELSEIISENLRYKTKFLVPKLGKKHKLLEMSLNNARIYADRSKPKWYEESKLNEKSAEELQKVLNLPNKLKRIECYDISHLSGTDTVASMIVFEKGVPKNNMYRKFKIRTIKDKPDDFKSMEEVLYRRLIKISAQTKLKDFSTKKIRKKDIKQILDFKLSKEEHKKFKSLEEEKEKIKIIVKEGEKPSSIIKVSSISKSNAFINYCYSFEKNLDIQTKLIKETLSKNSAKRFYFILQKDSKNLISPKKENLLLMGFQEVKKLNKEVEVYLKENKIKQNSEILMLEKIKLKKDPSFSKIPDLIVIDGGKGQLSSGTKVMKQLNLDIPYVSLAKKLEEIFIPGVKKSLILPRNHEGLKLLQKARDEAHRFAISFNRDLRKKRMLKKS